MGGMTDDLRLVQAVEKAAPLLERIAVANEKLIELAVEERQVMDASEHAGGPPFCPHCRTFNPSIRSEGGDGEMAEFVLVATCQCGRTFYARPQGWEVFDSIDQARSEMEGRTQ